MVQHQVARMEVGGEPLFRVWLACGHTYEMRRASFEGAGLKVPEIGDWLVCGDCTRLYGEAKQAERAFDAALQAGQSIATGMLNLRTEDAGAPGDGREWVFKFPLDDGRQLWLTVGAKGRAILERLILGEMLENARGAHDSQEDR